MNTYIFIGMLIAICFLAYDNGYHIEPRTWWEKCIDWILIFATLTFIWPVWILIIICLLIFGWER